MDAAAIEAQSFKLGLPGEGRRLKDHLFDGEQVIGLANAVIFQNSRALVVATRFRVLLVRAGFRNSTIVKRFEWAEVESLENYKPKWHEIGEEVLHFRGPGLDERILVVSGWQDFAKAAHTLLASRSSAAGEPWSASL